MPNEKRKACYLAESGLAEIWQRQLPGRIDLTTEDSEPIKVIYPGRRNDDCGPDLRDAVITTRQGILRGDVEIHAKSSSWWTHRHHLDPNYNRVILHVVFRADIKAATNLQNGQIVPTLALHRFTDSPAQRTSKPVYSRANTSIPCHNVLARFDSGFIGLFLDNAGKARFSAKAAMIAAELRQIAASQSLYQGIMGALGYTKNKLPFLELARRLPIQLLETVTQDKRSATEYLAHQQALLLGTAGLLPSQCANWSPVSRVNDEWLNKLEKVWASSQLTEAMSANDWHFGKVRPNNLPARRIAAISYLVLRYREKGIRQQLVATVRTAPQSKPHQWLEKALQVTTSGYWASHHGAGLPSRLAIPTLLGSRRAAETVVNILLPFTFAWSKLTAQQELAQKALSLYASYPRLAANTVERHMQHQLGISSDLVNLAQRQQGLIQIYRTLCSQGKCGGCPINNNSC